MDTTDFLLILFGAVLGWVGSFLTQTYQAWLNRHEAERQQRPAGGSRAAQAPAPHTEETRVISASRYKPLLGVRRGDRLTARARPAPPGVGRGYGGGRQRLVVAGRRVCACICGGGSLAVEEWGLNR